MKRAYFERYCSEGDYDENYLFHSGIEHCIEICDRFGLEVDSVLVLGAATGQVLRHFEDAWDVRPRGCEISRWAWSRIAPAYRRRISCGDMRHHVPRLLRDRHHFDLIFTNSLVYLPAKEIRAFLAQCARLGSWLHFYSSTSEDFEPGDRYRVTLRPRAWWRAAFVDAGFVPTRSRYLWRSTVTRSGSGSQRSGS